MSLELRSLTLTSAQTVFGKNGTQLAERMSDIHLTYDEKGKKVIVTSSNFPGKQEWIMEPMIGKMTWADPKFDGEQR